MRWGQRTLQHANLQRHIDRNDESAHDLAPEMLGKY